MNEGADIASIDGMVGEKREFYKVGDFKGPTVDGSRTQIVSIVEARPGGVFKVNIDDNGICRLWRKVSPFPFVVTYNVIGGGR